MDFNRPTTLLNQAHHYIKARLFDGAIALDATMGNGHDTLFLAQHVAPKGLVYSFDIQIAALKSTQTRLIEAGLLTHVKLLLQSHVDQMHHIDAVHQGRITAAMYNLGYLPGTDKQVVTGSESTIRALNTTLELLAPEGILTVLAYPGHPKGRQETVDVQHWITGLNRKRFQCRAHFSFHYQASAPILFVIEKQPSTKLA